MAAPTLLEWVSLLLLVSASAAYDFHVGGSDGWVVNPSEPFNLWAQRNRFQVNDKLVFRYTKGEDSVLSVTKEAYESCNTTNPIVRMEDGNSVFQFNSSGSFFFISGAPGQCEKGEKLVVVVMAARSGGKAQPPLATAPSLPPSVAAPSASSSGSSVHGSASKSGSLPAPAPSPAEAGSATFACPATVSWALLGLVLVVGSYFK